MAGTSSGIADSIATSRARRTTKQLTDLDPGKQVPSSFESDQSSPTYSDEEMIFKEDENFDDDEEEAIENFMNEFRDQGMGLNERLQIAAEMKTPTATGNPSDTNKKPEDAVAKKGSRKKKAPHSSESSYKADSEKLKEKKVAIVIRARKPGRPKSVEAECKLTSMVEAILQRQVKEAPVMISKVTSFLMNTTCKDEETYAEALKAFYDYLDNVAYPSFHLCFASEGKVPNAEL